MVAGDRRDRGGGRVHLPEIVDHRPHEVAAERGQRELDAVRNVELWVDAAAPVDVVKELHGQCLERVVLCHQLK